MATLCDVKVDFQTGRTFIDTEIGDAVLIYGVDVIIQNVAIRLNTQAGTVKRQELSDFGWDKRSKIKQKRTTGNIAAIADKLISVCLVDENVQDAKAFPIENTESETVIFDVQILLKDGIWYGIPVTIN